MLNWTESVRVSKWASLVLGSWLITGWVAGCSDGGGGPISGMNCWNGDRILPDGESGTCADGCNICTCNDGQLSSTLKSCEPDSACGGIAGLACDSSEYCRYASGCGEGDATGQCQPMPEACPEIYDPVCGCDNHNYGNSCEAAAAGVSVAHAGTCEAPTNSCVFNGETYPDGARIPSGGCNVCMCAGGFIACTGEACPEVQCGGEIGNTCSADEYCAYEEGQQCGHADAVSVCKRRPEVCGDQDRAPVCGCDNVTYPVACEAAAAGVGVLHSGACNGEGRSCIVGGVTYPDGKTNIPAPDGCNTCSCADGVLGCTELACGDKGCGGWLGDTCGESEYCAYTAGEHCGAADASSVCKPRPEACDTVYAPVCGCDGKTYSNDCDAAMHGTGYYRKGACE